MLAIILTAVGWTAAATGLMLWATGEIVVGNHDLMYDSGVVLMIGGVILGTIGAFMYRAAEARTEREIAARSANS